MAIPLTSIQAAYLPSITSETAPPGPSFANAHPSRCPLGRTGMREFLAGGLSWSGFGTGLDATREAEFEPPFHHSLVGLHGGIEWPASFALPDGTALQLPQSLFEHLDGMHAIASEVLSALRPHENAVFRHERLPHHGASHSMSVEWSSAQAHWHIDFTLERRDGAWHATVVRMDDGRSKAISLPLALKLPLLGVEAHVPPSLVAGQPALRDALLGGGSKRHVTTEPGTLNVSYATLVPCASGGARDQLVEVGLTKPSGGAWQVASARLEPIELPSKLHEDCVPALRNAGVPQDKVDFIAAQLQAPQANAQVRWSSKVAKEPVFSFEGEMPLYLTEQGTAHLGRYYIRVQFSSAAGGFRVRTVHLGPSRNDYECKSLRGGAPGPHGLLEEVSTASTASAPVSMPPVTSTAPGPDEATAPPQTIASTQPLVPGSDLSAPNRRNTPWLFHETMVDYLSDASLRRAALPGSPSSQRPAIRASLLILFDELRQGQGTPRPEVGTNVWEYTSRTSGPWHVQFADERSNIVFDLKPAAGQGGSRRSEFGDPGAALFPKHSVLYNQALNRKTMVSLGVSAAIALPYDKAQIKANIAIMKSAMVSCKEAVGAATGLQPATPGQPEVVQAANGRYYEVTWSDPNRTTCERIVGASAPS